MTTRQKIAAAAFLVSVGALACGAVAFPEWSAFVLQLLGMS